METPEQVKLKKEFIEKYIRMSREISQQRADTLKHYFNYTLKQSALNELEERLQKSYKIENDKEANRVKFKPGGTPSRDRVIAGEKLTLTLAQINELREYSHTYCQKNIEKIDIDLKERTQKLMLPLIKNSK
jgi:hypothetical protein